MPTASETLVGLIHDWLDDPENDVVYAEEVEGRWATRMRQQCRDYTTVWWHVGERTISVEAYVLPAPVANVAAVYRLCLKWNASTLRVRFALDTEDAVVLVARIPVEHAVAEVIDQVLAEVYEQVELGFRSLVQLAFVHS